MKKLGIGIAVALGVVISWFFNWMSAIIDTNDKKLVVSFLTKPAMMCTVANAGEKLPGTALASPEEFVPGIFAVKCGYHFPGDPITNLLVCLTGDKEMVAGDNVTIMNWKSLQAVGGVDTTIRLLPVARKMFRGEFGN